MTKIIVNTPGIANASNTLRNTQNEIDNAFSTLWGQMQVLADWRGHAGEAAQTTMHQFPPNNTARSSVLQNYINILEQQINPGHTQAETANKSLAAQFR
jgi:uncharacterized protein YukE